MKIRTKIEIGIIVSLMLITSIHSVFGDITITDNSMTDDTYGTIIDYDNNWINITNMTVGGNIGLSAPSGTTPGSWNGSSSYIHNSNGKTWLPTGTNLQAAIWDCNSTGGGWVSYSGNLTYSNNVTIGMSSYPKGMLLIFNGAYIVYTGTGWAITVNDSTYVRQFSIFGGEWMGTPANNPDGCFRLKDSGGCIIRPRMIKNFYNTNDNSCGISIENWYGWSEINDIKDTEIDTTDICIDFKPSTVTGGSGTVSFDGTTISDITLHPYVYGIRFRGSFYSSSFENINLWFADDNAVAYFLNGSMRNVKFSCFKAEDVSNAHTGEIVFQVDSGFNYDMIISTGGWWSSAGDTDLFNDLGASGKLFMETVHADDTKYRIWSLTDNTNFTFDSDDGSVVCDGRITAENSYMDADQLYVDSGGFEYTGTAFWQRADASYTQYLEGCSDNAWQSMFISFIRNRGGDWDSQAAVQAGDRVATFDFKVNNGSTDILVAGIQAAVNSTATINATPPGYLQFMVRDNVGNSEFIKMYPNETQITNDLQVDGSITVNNATLVWNGSNNTWKTIETDTGMVYYFDHL